MLEKKAQKDLERRNDALFAEKAANQVNYMNDMDRQASMKKQEVKQEYINSLNSQIKTEK